MTLIIGAIMCQNNRDKEQSDFWCLHFNGGEDDTCFFSSRANEDESPCFLCGGMNIELCSWVYREREEWHIPCMVGVILILLVRYLDLR